MALTVGERKALESFGSTRQIDKRLSSFRRTAALLSSRRAHLVERYPEQWVAVYRGRVRARGGTLSAVVAQIDSKALPREDVIIRFINRADRVFIL